MNKPQRTHKKIVDHQICKRCKIDKPIDSYSLKRVKQFHGGELRNYTYYRKMCKSCMHQTQTKKWIDKNRTRYYNNMYKWMNSQLINNTNYGVKFKISSLTGLSFKLITPELIIIKRKIDAINKEITNQS